MFYLFPRLFRVSSDIAMPFIFWNCLYSLSPSPHPPCTHTYHTHTPTHVVCLSLAVFSLGGCMGRFLSGALHAFSWPCWAWLAHGHLSAQCPFHTCGNLSPWWALARVKLQGWGAAQGAGARLVGPTARLTWTGRACGLRLQRCGLSRNSDQI